MRTATPNYLNRYRRLLTFREPVLKAHHLLFCRQGDVSSTEMAEIIGRSERQAREIFHDIIGESFRAAQLRGRLMPVRVAVRHTSDPISEIARRSGYSNRKKFDKSYAALFGLTPAADRLAQKTAGQGGLQRN